jgi:hypothetical protein
VVSHLTKSASAFFFFFQVALLNPIENPDLKLAIVMLIVPFFVNVSAMLYVLPQIVPCSSVFLFRVLF